MLFEAHQLLCDVDSFLRPADGDAAALRGARVGVKATYVDPHAEQLLYLSESLSCSRASRRPRTRYVDKRLGKR